MDDQPIFSKPPLRFALELLWIRPWNRLRSRFLALFLGNFRRFQLRFIMGGATGADSTYGAGTKVGDDSNNGVVSNLGWRAPSL